jgi:hypothetical protein
MKKLKLTLLLSIIAQLMTSPAFADSVYVTQDANGFNTSVTINQYGGTYNSNYTTVNQTGTDLQWDTVYINQTGMGNQTASVSQSGQIGNVIINQVGDGDKATITQGFLTVDNGAYIHQEEQSIGEISSITQDNGSGNVGDIYQNGSADVAAITETGSSNSATIFQTYQTYFETANIVESGMYNNAYIHQAYAFSDFALINQDGSGNIGLIDQNGWYTPYGIVSEYASIVQIGNSNKGFIYQGGRYDTASINQSGDGNIALITQGFISSVDRGISSWVDSNNETASIIQSGNNHTGIINQYSSNYDIASINQSGDNNTATITQGDKLKVIDSSDNYVNVTQNGLGNNVTVDQLGSGKQAWVTQTGSSLNAKVIQN